MLSLCVYTTISMVAGDIIRLWCKQGRRHSSVDLSMPSIQPPCIRVPSTPSMLFSIYIAQTVYLSIEFEYEKNENKQKEAGIGPFLNKLAPQRSAGPQKAKHFKILFLV